MKEAAPARLFRRLALCSLACVMLGLFGSSSIDQDLWHEMALIRDSLSAGELLRTNVYAYTPPAPIVRHEWGAGAIAYFLTSWFGGYAILVLKYALVLMTALLCLRCAEVRGSSFPVLALFAPLAILLSSAGFYALLRAHVYSFLFAALLLWSMEKDRKGDRRWILAFIAVWPLWVNVHGGFLLGLALAGLYWLERLLDRAPHRHILLVLGAGAASTIVNPDGFNFVTYLWSTIRLRRPDWIPEWYPVWNSDPLWMWGFTAAAVIALLVWLKAGARRLPGLLLVLGTAAEAMLHRKQLPFFAMAWLCFVPSWLEPTRAGRRLGLFVARHSQAVLAVFVVAGVFFAGIAIQAGFWRVTVPGDVYPAGPVRYLRQVNFKGNVMAPLTVSAYVSWRLFPSVRIAADTRFDVAYDPALTDRIMRFYEAKQGWRETLDAYPTDLVLVSAGAPVRQLLAGSGWRRTYADAQFELYARPGTKLPIAGSDGPAPDDVFP